jgi:chemotaxis protein methyltransferase CheR
VNDQEYSYLKSKVLKLTNLDLNAYKNQQMRRRLDMYVSRQNYPTFMDYCQALEKSPQKQREIMDYLAINVSEFFRDSSQFKTLQTVVLPQLLATNRRLNIWSAACSCGQEPYTLAMILNEMNSGFSHRILATDIDRSALEQAQRGGPYLPLDIKNVEKSILFKYFTHDEAGYWVKEEIKKKITFQYHNLLSDPFEQHFDLIVCRNVIIYFSDIIKDLLYRKFHQSLKIGGVLYLGGSEVVLRPGDQGFKMLQPAFYRKFEFDFMASHPTQDLSGVIR